MSRLLTASFAAAALVAAAALLTPGSASANGVEFFEEDESADVGLPFFGFVRETSGKLVPDAVITATIKEMNSTLTARTDVLGHYRIPGFAKTVDPKNVEIACSKQGYKQVTVLPRPTPPNTAIEVDCTLAKD
ncbi:MAG: carboxypeptidase-like regulatory domain-containing protein [Gemmatimonas sp.]